MKVGQRRMQHWAHPLSYDLLGPWWKLKRKLA
jgi:hypothetical protein